MEGIDQTQDKYVVILGSAPSEMRLLNPTLPEALRADSFKKKKKKQHRKGHSIYMLCIEQLASSPACC